MTFSTLKVLNCYICIIFDFQSNENKKTKKSEDVTLMQNRHVTSGAVSTFIYFIFII